MTPRPRVLLVEDNPDDTRLTELALRASGLDWELQLAEDGLVALEYLAANPAELVLLDLNLPGLSGLEVLQRLRTLPAYRNLPVVMLSSSANPTDREHAQQAGANLYLQKPLSLLAFTGTLRTHGPGWLRLGQGDGGTP